jgi:hypothetical protein
MRMSIRPPSDPFPYPRELVVGVVSGEGDGEHASESLSRAGFAPDHVIVLHGEQDARRLDVTGGEHGPPGKLIRTLQAALSFDLDHIRRHATHLRSGDYVVGVAVGKDEDARQRAVDALRDAGAGFINYYGDNYIEAHEPDSHAPPARGRG